MWSYRRLSPSARLALGFVLVFVCAPLPTAHASTPQAAPPPWNEPFNPDTAALRAAADALEPAEEGVRVLWEQETVRFADDGGREIRRRLVYRVDSEFALEGWGQVQVGWEPWHQERPRLRARVLTADGGERRLDPATIAEEPRDGGDAAMFSDALVLRAPLPGVEVGALVEQETVVAESPRLPGAGIADRFYFGYNVPTEVSRLVLDVPESLPFAWHPELLENAAERRSEGDRRILTFAETDLPRESVWEPGLPPEVPFGPAVAFSTGASWQAVAEAYAEVVERQTAGADLAARVDAATAVLPDAATLQDGGDRRAVVDALVAWVHDEVRYTGLEFSEAAIVPRSPGEVLERGYGDCKDKSALLLALLREAGIPAHLALLGAGDRRDPLPELPGFGGFNHAILYVPGAGGDGTEDLWIDATAPYHPAGLLPTASQGRLALIARPGETGLVTTPATTSRDNQEIVHRRVEMAELGFAAVVETAEFQGGRAADLRAVLAPQSEQELARTVEGYVADTHGGELVDWTLDNLRDSGEALSLRTRNRGAQWAHTALFDAALRASMDDLVAELPTALANPPEPEDREGEGNGEGNGEGGAAEDGRRPQRRHDLVVAEPLVMEYRTRVDPPTGFRLVDPPEDLEAELGPARLTRRLVEHGDGTLELVATFDSGPRRYTAEQVEATWAALEEWSQEERSLLLLFENVGQSHLMAGRVAEAIAEFRDRVEDEPDNPLHRIRLSQALLEAGLGEPARREARRAVELDPDLALAHQFLGWALLHDLVGRNMTGDGWDRQGAEAALRRAKELDPESDVVRRNLAVLLEHDAEGRRYSRQADLDAAIAEYRAFRRELDDHSLDDNLLVALYHAGRLDEVRELAGEMPDTLSTRSFLLAATAADDGVDAALREARSVGDEQQRRQLMAQTGQLLLLKRLYRQAAALFAAAARGAGEGAAGLLSLAERLRRLERAEEMELEGEAPEDVPRRMMLLVFTGQREELERFAAELGLRGEEWEAFMNTAELEDLEEMGRDMDQVDDDGVPVGFVVDTVLDSMEVRQDGDGAAGQRLTLDIFGDTSSWYLVAPGGGARTLVAVVGEGEMDDLAALASRATKLLEDGSEEGLAAARTWLDWAREELPPPFGDDPYAGPSFVHLWPTSGERSPEVVRRAAAALQVHEDLDGRVAEAALERLRRERGNLGAVQDGEAAELATFLDLAIAEGLMARERPEEAVPVLRRVVDAHPGSEGAFLRLAGALTASDRTVELGELARRRLERTPDDEAAVAMLVPVSLAEGDVEAAIGWLRRIEDSGSADATTYNNLAWYQAVVGEVDRTTLRDAHRAVEDAGEGSSAALHTLATIYAELDRPLEARDVLHQALSARGELAHHDWYVVGRMAESYGETAAAEAAYRRIEKPEQDSEVPLSTWWLAERRLKALGKEATGDPR